MTTVSTWICFSTEEGQYFTQKREDTTFLWFLYFFTQVQILTIYASLAAISFAAPSPQAPPSPGVSPPPGGQNDPNAVPPSIDSSLFEVVDVSKTQGGVPPGDISVQDTDPNPQDAAPGAPSDDLNLQYVY
ncbi:hypothetical protein RMCBS344292_16782 [Rhizopus microsporus]|nr:hypothetical protein RMCBS344292_05258 [Rhizopus microsporus]CEI98927.1 hypothetical protein RMCBS344292_13023 [Rhizopus microsporus]CEJ02787.1 hypothetical protein RMCBS344292_16782 [Rhizopus microsporus]